jgi:thiosulfate dehydrogenase [quinone] large subunit
MPSSSTLAVLLRIAFGWLFFHAGLSKILDPAWSAAPYLAKASTFPSLFAWLASPGILPATDFLNAWGLFLIGLSLLVGLLVRWSTPAGAALMFLYYLPALRFPYAGSHSVIVDEHVVYLLALLLLARLDAGGAYGLDGVLRRKGKARPAHPLP